MPAQQGNEMGMGVVDAMWNVDGAAQQAWFDGELDWLIPSLS